MPREIFISYSTEDRAVADNLCASLEASGLHCWIAPRNIEPGSSWTASIMSAIAECQVMVLIFSSKSNESTHVVREILHAVEKRRQVFPIRIEEVVPTGGLAYCLVGVQWFDATTAPLDRHTTALVAQIRQVLQRSGDIPAAPHPQAGVDAPISGNEPDDIYFECHQCGQRLVTEAASAGQTFPCPSCATIVTIPKLAGQTLEKLPPAQDHIAPAPAVPASVSFDPAVLADLAATLATFVGPLAKVLVNRAAAKASSRPELLDRLAAEIDSPGDRERFLQAARTPRRG